MPWSPSTEFEEEVVNLQPDHDFIYGELSEPVQEPGFPRPQAHIDYAYNLKKQAAGEQELYETTGRINEKLHVISRIQRLAGTKPLGEQATINDWDSDTNLERETVGMMRHYGMGPSVEQPLNSKVTIATFPVDSSMHVMKNGNRKIPLFFDENIFELRPKVSNSSSGFESSNSNDSNINLNDSSLSSATDTSFNTSSASSFYTGVTDSPKSNVSMTAYKKAQIEREAERMRQYDKLNEETSLLSISNNNTEDYDSFKTAKENNSWVPYAYEDGQIFNSKNINWPTLNADKKNDFIPSKSWYSKKSSISSSSMDDSYASSSSANTSQDLYSSNCESYNTGETNNSDNSFQKPHSKNFLNRFIKPEYQDSTATSSADGSFVSTSNTSSSSSSLNKPPSSSYAEMTKSSTTSVRSKKQSGQGATPKKTSDIIQNTPQFYSTREVYERKRRVQ